MLTLTAVLLAATALVAPTAQGPSSQPTGQTPKRGVEPVAAATIVDAQRPSYPLKTCVISGEALDSMGGPIDYVVDGRLVRLCCKGCIKRVEAEKEQAFAKIEAAVVREQKPSYPLKTCPISDETLGADAIDHVYGTRLVRVCCKKCGPQFDKNPEPYFAKIDAALIAAQRKDYPLEACVISGEPLGDDAVDHLYGTRLVRMCCSKCVRVFSKTPETFMKDYEAAVAQASKK